MTEKEAVDAAHAATVQKLAMMLSDAFAQASTADARRQAEERFQHGLGIAREARERALALVGAQNP